MKTVFGAGCAALAVLAAPVFAQEPETVQEQAAPQAPPGCPDEVYRVFDFWVGDWEVRTPDGQLAGYNSIQPIYRGCGLLEQYSSRARQPAGQSLNYYDKNRGVWGQTWVSAGSVILLEGVSPSPGVMTMHGTIAYPNQPHTRGFAGRWTLQEDGTVKQQFWEQDPETGEWGDWFTGIYTRVDEGGEP